MTRGQQNIYGLIVYGGVMGVMPLAYCALIFPEHPIMATVVGLVALVWGLRPNVNMYLNYRKNTHPS